MVSILIPTVLKIRINQSCFLHRIGPQNPFKTEQEAAVKNTLSGYVEPAHVNDFQFETQRRTFQSYGYAHDPSSGKLGCFITTVGI